MKTTNKTKLKKILLSGFIALTLLFSNFFGLTNGLISMIAFADYKSENYKSYTFDSTSSWSTSTNYESTDNRPFEGSTSKFDMITTVADNDWRPETKYDGVSSVIASGSTRDKHTDDYALYIKSNNAPNTQVQKDKDNFVSFATKTEAEDGGYIALKVEDNKWIRLFNPDNIATSETSWYKELTAEEKATVSTEYDGTDAYAGYKKKYAEKTVDIYFGYKSSSITLNANAYYAVTFWAYTKVGSPATFVVSGTNYKKAITVDTQGKWVYNVIFITGKSDSSTSVNLYYYLGTDTQISTSASVTGFALLDNVVVKTINQTDYNQRTIDGLSPVDGKNEDDSNTAESLNKLLSENKIEGYVYTENNYQADYYTPRKDLALVVNNNMNADFTDANFTSLYRKDDGYAAATENKWSAYIPKYTSDSSTTSLPNAKYNEYVAAYTSGTALITAKSVSEKDEFATGEDPEKVLAPSTFEKDNKILKLTNTSASLDLGFSSNAIKIKQFGLYRISLFLKATADTEQAIVKMHSEIQIGTGPSQIIKSQDIVPYQTTSDATNNWMEVIFYVRGNALHDYNAYLTILAGSQSTIYVDNIRVEQISSSTYSSGTSSKKLDLALSTSMPTTGIANGYFTSIKITDDEKTQVAPFEADSWTLGKENTSSVVSGVIPTTNAWDATKIGNVSNPNTSSAKTNVYAIYAPDADSNFTLTTSSTFSLSSSNVYKIFFSVYGASNVQSGSLKVSLLLGTDKIETLLIPITLSNSATWTTYAIYVRIDDSSRSLYLDFNFEDIQGTFFLKDIRHVTIADIKEDDNKTVKLSDDQQFVEAMKDAEANTYFLDFMSESFTEVGTNPTVNGLYPSLNYELVELDKNSTIEQGKVGIIFTDANYISEGNGTIAQEDIDVENNISKKVLIIENTVNTQITQITPNIVHSLSKSSFYKLTFKVKTNDILDGGLTIKINSLSIAISKVDTTDDTNKNNPVDGYRTYTVFVRTGDTAITSTYVGFELTGKGYALIADINLEKLKDEEAYKSAISGVEESTETYIKDYFVEKDTDSSSPEAEDSNGTLAIFFYILSSLLLVAAIVIALVAVYAKKHPIKKRVVGTNKADLTSYDKDGKPVSKRKAKNDADKGGFV